MEKMFVGLMVVFAAFLGGGLAFAGARTVKARVRAEIARVEAEIETEMRSLGPDAQEGARRILIVLRRRLGLL